MKREIKFRAWNKFTKTMVPSQIVSRNFHKYNTDENWELMQFTGTEDKNGVDIYEGDILTFDLIDTEDGQVIRGEKGSVKCHGLGSLSFKGWKSHYCTNKVVIGNIYEETNI